MDKTVKNQSAKSELLDGGVTGTTNVDVTRAEWLNEIVADLSLDECKKIMAYVCFLKNQCNPTRRDLPLHQVQ